MLSPILELAAIFLGSLAFSCVLAWLVEKVARRVLPIPAPPPVKFYAYTMRFNGALIEGVISSPVGAASLALHGLGKPTVRA